MAPLAWEEMWGGELRFWGAPWGRGDGAQRVCRNGRSPYSPWLGKGTDPTAHSQPGKGTQTSVVQEWSSVFRVLSLGHLPKHVLPFLGLSQPRGWCVLHLGGGLWLLLADLTWCHQTPYSVTALCFHTSLMLGSFVEGGWKPELSKHSLCIQ